MSYYIVKIRNIPEVRRQITASKSKDEWLRKLIRDALSEKLSEFDAEISFTIFRNGRTIELAGGIYFNADVECDKCLEKFEFEQQIPFHILLEPAPKKDDKSEEYQEDSEGLDGELDFSYYEGETVDLGEIIRQHVSISEPIRLICSEECKGLCSKCGKNLNKTSCDCREEVTNSPFSVLKGFKTH